VNRSPAQAFGWPGPRPARRRFLPIRPADGMRGRGADLADEDGVAAPSGDDQRLGLVVDLIDDAVEMGAGGGCRYSGHSKSVR